MTTLGRQNGRTGAPGARDAADAHDAPWGDVNLTARSLLAAAALSVCVVLAALSGAATAERAAAVRAADAALAEDAALFAEYAAFLAGETARARARLDAPRVKPAKPVRAILAHYDPAADLVDFDFTQLEVARIDAEERRCLAQAIYYEARSESRIGQLAVADVVLNRVASPLYPNSICEVVYQGSERRTGCQFTFTCDGSMKARLNQRKWAEAEDLAGAILAGLRVPVSRNATHYHADYVSPPWAERLTPTAAIGTHRFYRFPTRTTVASAAPVEGAR
ncbi:cell wall hydrolase [Amphiplicatus metriothermophilus]|uniref:Cell wall hydrolase CwlJ, involved in spore germination n=1 Tax=Amphiplicatus metriothermophilus TaxID=1519374 RepID=A0A239PYY8_9PROT|nr:cell wall hydrolase [Amphiplicatus metriothermophilus]MBB5518295.1 spore germination cell wall hydrolase CwlJ-like protein [Amphiplicatus metriothermophilus]SNT75549.1 Cell wall hydrolase CwlJ, involved in spore germination [Amphiplicatus metriothermophilus]